MKRNYIWALAIVITFTMVGLIIIQSYWIRNAINLRAEQFDQQVNKAINNTITDLEEDETVYYIIKEINALGKDSSKIKNTTNVDSLKINFDTDLLFYNTDSNNLKKHSNIEYLKPDCVIIKNDKIDFSSSNQVYTRKRLSESYVSKVRDKTIFVEKIIDKLIQHHLKIEERINPAALSSTLKRDLANQGIDLAHEFCAKDNHNNIIFKSQNYIESHVSKSYINLLFPDDIMAPQNFLVLYFPAQKNYIYHSLGLMASSSVILTLIIILIFTFSIFIIFRQKQLSQIKNDFINNMTHELKTPISTISLASQMLNDKSISSENKNYENLSKIIQEESKRLGFQVEKVLQMAVFERVNLHLKFKRINSNDFIHHVVQNFNVQIMNRNGKINLYLNAEDPMITVDEIHFTNVIVNLLENALKYCTKDPIITIASRSYKKGIIISFEDNGIGISKDNQKRIFERFYRVPTGNVHNVKGFGLGLSYVKKILDEHKAEIKVASEPGVGSTFTIILPNDLNIN